MWKDCTPITLSKYIFMGYLKNVTTTFRNCVSDHYRSELCTNSSRFLRFLIVCIQLLDAIR